MGKHLKKHFEDMRITNKYMQKCSTLSVIRKMEIKTAVRKLCIHTREAVIKKTDNTNCWQRFTKSRPIVPCW